MKRTYDHAPNFGNGQRRRGALGGRGGVCFLALALLLAGGAFGERKPIYDPIADGHAQLRDAFKQAKAGGKRVLVQWGANWCGWCHLLHDYFEENEEAREILSSSYVLVLVDSDANKDLMAELQVKTRGIPYLSIFDADGKKLVDQDTGSLETGPRHDPAKVNPFLKRWQAPAAPPASASALIEAATKEAKSAEKNVFLVFGTEWCGWCRRLEDLLANDVVGPLIAKNYVVVKLDEEKTEGAKAYRKANAAKLSRGVPWYAVVAADGKVLATSDAGGTNTGYPASRLEIDTFMNVIRSTAKHLKAEERVVLEAEVRRIGRELSR